MRLLLTVVVFVGLLAAAPGRAAEPSPAYDPLGFENPLSPVMRAYREAPQPEETLKLFLVLNIRWFVGRDHIDEARRVRDVITAFYAQILRANPALAEPFATTLGSEGTGHHLDVGAAAIRVADPPELKSIFAAMKEARLARYEGDEHARLEEALDRLIAGVKELPAFPYAGRAPRNRSQVDELWAAFYAGGDEIYLERLFDTLDDWPGRTCIEALGPMTTGGSGAETGNPRLALCPRGQRYDPEYLRTTEHVRHTLAKQAEADPVFAARLADYAQDRGGTAGGLVLAIVSGQAGR